MEAGREVVMEGLHGLPGARFCFGGGGGEGGVDVSCEGCAGEVAVAVAVAVADGEVRSVAMPFVGNKWRLGSDVG